MTDTADATQSDPAGHAPRPLVAGNWKMNGDREALNEALAVRDALRPASPGADVMICPPATLLMVMAELIDKDTMSFGGQDCHVKTSGAHTGDISAQMLKDAGASAVIVGHSERREDHFETDNIVRQKARAAQTAGLAAIICVGETAGQRKADLTLDVVTRQLANSVPEAATATNTAIAYEPVWAIGTGVTPTLDDVATVHGAIRKALLARFGEPGAGIRILYGGSVKPDNAGELMAIENVNGALVGGASLKASDFLEILKVYGS